MKVQFLVSVRFVFEKLISSAIGKKLPIFDLQNKKVRHFLNIYCHYNYITKYITKYADDNMTYL